MMMMNTPHGYSRGCIINSFIGKEYELLYASFGNILLNMHSSLMMTMEKVGRGIRLFVENISRTQGSVWQHSRRESQNLTVILKSSNIWWVLSVTTKY